MENKHKFLIYIGFMLTYVFTVFYLSEPKFINDLLQKDPQIYDYVITPKYSSWDHVEHGIVLQKGNGRILIKITSDAWSKDKDLSIESDQYRIVGRGTIYHKVHQYIGFNIIMITQIIIGILCAILIIKVSGIII